MEYDFKYEIKYLKMFQNIGVNLEAIISKTNLSLSDLQKNKLKLSLEQYKKIMMIFNDNIDKEKIVSFSKLESIKTFIPEFYAGLCAKNGLECIKRIAKYKELIAPVRIIIECKTNTTTISYKYNDKDDLPNLVYLNAFINILSIIRKGSDDNSIKPKEIYANFEYPLSALEYIGSKPKKSNINKIVFNNTDLEKKFVSKNNVMWEYLKISLDKELNMIYEKNKTSSIVKEILFKTIPRGENTIEKIAGYLFMNKRTLQRKLSDEGCKYNELLNNVRKILVCDYIKKGMKIEEIAFLVNYSEAKSLSRAFKLWMGMTLSQYRNTIN